MELRASSASLTHRPIFECVGFMERLRLSGTVMKFNRKTVTVVTDTSQRWNISPHLLSPIKNVQAGTVVDIRPQKMK